MGCCVAGYAQGVQSGESYIYRVLRPERATLELALRPGHEEGEVQIAQVKLAHNHAPSLACWRAVRDWFAASKNAASRTEAQGQGE